MWHCAVQFMRMVLINRASRHLLDEMTLKATEVLSTIACLSLFVLQIFRCFKRPSLLVLIAAIQTPYNPSAFVSMSKQTLGRTYAQNVLDALIPCLKSITIRLQSNIGVFVLCLC